MSKINLGKIVKAQGIKGEMKVYPEADLSFFSKLKEVYLNNNISKTSLKVNRVYQNMVYISLPNITTRNDAEKMVGTELYVDREDLILSNDEFLVDDLLNMNVFLDNGEDYGTIIEVNNYGSADIFVILGKFGKWQVPYVDGVVKNVDVANKKIILNKKRFEEVRV